MSDIRLFAVTGKPVLHSRSPRIFNRLFESLGLDAVYVRLQAGSGREALESMRAMDISGMNVTSPFKEEIASLVDELDPVARRLQAANCVVKRNGGLDGFNTDAQGVVGALESRGVSIAGKAAVVLGAGGAARAAAWGLGDRGARPVTLINRTLERAESSARIAGCGYAPWESMDAAFEEAGILVSCLPQGRPITRLGRLGKGAAVLDADYRDPGFILEARRLGHPAADGLDWLVQQALPSFRLMTGFEDAAHLEESIDRDELAAPSEIKPNIALAGLSGAGKTTIGQLLAGMLGWDFVDTDAAIEAAEGLSVPDIFRRFGEARFRGDEKAAVRRFLPGTRRAVFALGGGTLLDPENLALVRANCVVVWLWISPRTAIGRIPAASRPLLESADPERAAGEIAAARRAVYARASDLVVNTEIGNAEETARRIAHEMG